MRRRAIRWRRRLPDLHQSSCRRVSRPRFRHLRGMSRFFDGITPGRLFLTALATGLRLALMIVAPAGPGAGPAILRPGQSTSAW